VTAAISQVCNRPSIFVEICREQLHSLVYDGVLSEYHKSRESVTLSLPISMFSCYLNQLRQNSENKMLFNGRAPL